MSVYVIKKKSKTLRRVGRNEEVESTGMIHFCFVLKGWLGGRGGGDRGMSLVVRLCAGFMEKLVQLMMSCEALKHGPHLGRQICVVCL